MNIWVVYKLDDEGTSYGHKYFTKEKNAVLYALDWREKEPWALVAHKEIGLEDV